MLNLKKIASALIVAGLLAVGMSSSPAEAHMKAHCKQVLVQQIDPVVARGSLLSAHMHSFAGANIQETLDPTRAGWTELQNVTTTCLPNGDKAVYWVPTMYMGTEGPVVPMSSMIGYYGCFQGHTVDRCPTGQSVEAYPQNLRLVAGDSSGRWQDPNVVSWVCRVAGGTPVGPFKTPAEADCETRVPDNKGMSLHVDFQSCWDGVSVPVEDGNSAWADGPTGSVADHVVWPDNHPSKTATCPLTHPRKLSHLRLDINYRCGALDSWSCESDSVQFSSGGQETMHADFLNGWTPEGMAAILGCVNPGGKHVHDSIVCGT